MIVESSDITMIPGLFLAHSDNKEDTEELCGNLCINAASGRENSAWWTVLRLSFSEPK